MRHPNSARCLLPHETHPAATFHRNTTKCGSLPSSNCSHQFISTASAFFPSPSTRTRKRTSDDPFFSISAKIIVAMAMLPQRVPALRPQHIAFLPPRVRRSPTAPPKPRRSNSVETGHLGPAVTSRPPVLNDPTLKSTWSHRAWLAGGCSTVVFSLAKSVAGAAESHIWIEPITAGLVGYVLADLGSGVYHWGIDNYGRAETPVFGPQIEGFQGHHKWPWTITRRQFANNLHALAKAVTFTVLPINLLSDDPVFLGLVAACSGCIMFSQQFHAWAHTTKSRLPPLVAAMQDGGVLLSRTQHAAHHRAPYNNNYCIVSGVWNEILDNSRFFEAMEMIIFFKFGVRPRSWTEPNSDWIEEAETASL